MEKCAAQCAMLIYLSLSHHVTVKHTTPETHETTKKNNHNGVRFWIMIASQVVVAYQKKDRDVHQSARLAAQSGDAANWELAKGANSKQPSALSFRAYNFQSSRSHLLDIRMHSANWD